MTEYALATVEQVVAAEQVVLGAMMTTVDAVKAVDGLITGRDFYRPPHATIHDAIVELCDRGEPCDPVAVAAYLADGKTLTRVGGMPYLTDCYAAVPTAASVTHYARLVAGAAALRALDTAGAQIGQLARNTPPADAAAAVERARDILTALGDASGATTLMDWPTLSPTVLEAIEAAADLTDGPAGIPTGLVDLDRLTGGWKAGQLIVVAGRPGMGKSTAVAGFAQHAAMRHKIPSAVFSLEMTGVELGMRMLSAGTRIPLHAIQTGALTDQDWVRIARYVGDTEDAPLWIDDTANITLGEIRAHARRMHRQHGLALLVVDHLGLIDTPNAENRQVAVAGLSRNLKVLAKELQISVVLAAQLNRGPENRADKRPTLADLRESGAIEADADIVIFPHRDDYYDKESPRAGEADFIVAKHRNGPTDTITVAAQLHFSRFVDMALPLGGALA